MEHFAPCRQIQQGKTLPFAILRRATISDAIPKWAKFIDAAPGNKAADTSHGITARSTRARPHNNRPSGGTSFGATRNRSWKRRTKLCARDKRIADAIFCRL